MKAGMQKTVHLEISEAETVQLHEFLDHAIDIVYNGGDGDQIPVIAKNLRDELKFMIQRM